MAQSINDSLRSVRALSHLVLAVFVPLLYFLGRSFRAAPSVMPFTARSVYPTAEGLFARFPSRRSVVHSTKGIVACSQPLAAEAGQRILKQGGNAAVRPPERPRSAVH